MIRALVVDDEELARRNLRVLLSRDREIESVAECASGDEAVKAIQESQPQLVFLDVQMPECGGFDVLELLGGRAPPAIVFVTAHEEYALRAFEAGALDYLLKPFDDARFFRALDRAKARIARSGSPERRRVVIKEQGQVVFLSPEDIDWVEAAGYYACLRVGGATHVIRRTLSELESDLGDRFVRIHRSIIVNLDRIQGLALQESGEYEVVLKTQVRLRLSRRLKRNLQERLGLIDP
jgi:two-component system LytT family response regulator